MVAGGMITGMLGLQPPPMPEGMDVASSGRNLMLLSPLFALALALLARGLAGTLLARGLILSVFAWTAYSLNNAIEGVVVTSLPVSSAAFAAVIVLSACFLCAFAVAWLFPAADPGHSWRATAREFFARRTALSWAWRLGLAAVCFAPVYWFFGLLVTPFTLDYYRESLYGLRMPEVEVLVPVLLLRSLLFMLATLPIIAGWLLRRRASSCGWASPSSCWWASSTCWRRPTCRSAYGSRIRWRSWPIPSSTAGCWCCSWLRADDVARPLERVVLAGD
jgi:hypothetical protein